MTNRRSPCLTIWPSLKWIESMNPETRERTSTVAKASNRPVYSSHSVIDFWIGCETVTEGGGGVALLACLLSQPATAQARTVANAKMAARVIRVFSNTRQAR